MLTYSSTKAALFNSASLRGHFFCRLPRRLVFHPRLPEQGGGGGEVTIKLHCFPVLSSSKMSAFSFSGATFNNYWGEGEEEDRSPALRSMTTGIRKEKKKKTRSLGRPSTII